MNNSFQESSLYDVLDAYSEAAEYPNREILATWIARYPQYERELIEFTVGWIQSEQLPQIPEDPQHIDTMMESAFHVIQQILEKKSVEEKARKLQTRAGLVSLIMEGSLLGWSINEFAQRINLSVTILRKLENRLIRVATVPTSLIERISTSIQRDPSEVTAYLGQAPMLQPGLQYKSKQSPKIGNQQDFFDAVRNDGELSVEQRAYWLSFEARTG